MKISIEELIETADALIAPVRMGVVRPTAPFAMSSSSIDVCLICFFRIFFQFNCKKFLFFSFQSSDDLFNVEPLAPTSTRTGNNLQSRAVASRSSNDMASNFLSRLDANYRIRSLDDANAGDTDTVIDNVQDDEDASELDELPDRSNIRSNSNLDEDVQDPLRGGEDAAQEGESDIEFFHEAETESDSDDNQSAQEIQQQRTQTTAVAANSDVGMYRSLVRSHHGCGGVLF